MPHINGIPPLHRLLQNTGSSTDLWTQTKTLLGFSNASYQHIHMPAKVYPTLAPDAEVTTSATANTLGDAVQLIPADEIATPFDIHWLNISDMSANGTYEIVLYIAADAGLTDLTEIGRVRVTRTANITSSDNTFIQVPVIPASSRIATKAACTESGAKTVKFSVHYHGYE